MSTFQAFSVGVGVVLRVIINSVGFRNDKLAGALSGIWDGIVVYAAWRTDRLLEPTVLIEVIAGVCFDALYNGTPTRLVSLALGTVLGVLVSDTTGLHALWDDLGENVQVKLRDLPVDIRDDLDSLDVLSEFSEDVTVIYTEHASGLTPRTRKMTTKEWIAAQRSARQQRTSNSATSRSRRIPVSTHIDTITDLDKSLLSRFDTQTQSTSRTNPTTTIHTQSSRARRDRDLLATMTPLPPPSGPSVTKTSVINIDVLSPSISTRESSPTIKPKTIEEISVRESVHGAVIDLSKDISGLSSPPKSHASRSNRSVREKADSIKLEATVPPVERAPSPLSSKTERAAPLEEQVVHQAYTERSVRSTTKDTHEQTPRSKYTYTITDQSSFAPFIPPRPVDSREASVISVQDSHLRPKSASHRSPKILSEDPSLDRVATELLSNWNDDLRARLVRSRASTLRSERVVEEAAGASAVGPGSRHTTVKSRSSVRPTSGVGEEAQAYTRSELGHTPAEEPAASPSAGPEVIIDYSGETTRIYIPPPAETGINVRIVPRVEQSQTQLESVAANGDDLYVDHDNYLSEIYHRHDGRPRSVGGSAAREQDEMTFIHHSTGSFPDLDTVPPVDEQGTTARVDVDARHSHHSASHASQPSRASQPEPELTSDPQPPSVFDLKKAWRSSVPPVSSSTTDYGGIGRVVEPDNPLPVYIYENVDVVASEHVAAGVGLGEPSGFFNVARSRAGSTGDSSHAPVHRRSRSAAAASRHSHKPSHSRSRSHARTDTLGLDTRGAAGPAELTPSVEWFGPGASALRARSARSRSRRQSVGERSHARSQSRRHSTDHSQARDKSSRRRSGSIISIARSHDPRQSSTFISSPTVDGSILSPRSHRSKSTTTHNNSLRARATELDDRANEMEARCTALKETIVEAERNAQGALAFTLGCELEEAQERATKLRRRAERALNAARAAEEIDEIDVHHLGPLEAVQAVKNALHALRRRGRSKLSVTVDRGQRTAEGSSVRRYYIADQITKKYHLDVRNDETNPNVLYIVIPPSTS